jgi:hypothetical protein
MVTCTTIDLYHKLISRSLIYAQQQIIHLENMGIPLEYTILLLYMTVFVAVCQCSYQTAQSSSIFMNTVH